MAPTTHPRSEGDPVSAALLEGARAGDWSAILGSLDEMSQARLPHNSAALHDRARALEEALTIAKAIRADLAASLVRLTAAARFSCQDSDEPSKF